MSNGTRKKKVDFKKLLITEEETNLHYRKKSTKSSNIPQITSNKKNKSHKIMPKPKEVREKPSEKNVTKKGMGAFNNFVSLPAINKMV